MSSEEQAMALCSVDLVTLPPSADLAEVRQKLCSLNLAMIFADEIQHWEIPGLDSKVIHTQPGLWNFAWWNSDIERFAVTTYNDNISGLCQYFYFRFVSEHWHLPCHKNKVSFYYCFSLRSRSFYTSFRSTQPWFHQSTSTMPICRPLFRKTISSQRSQ